LIECDQTLADKVGEYFASGLPLVNIVNNRVSANLIIINDVNSGFSAREYLDKFFLYISSPKENTNYDFPANVWVLSSHYLFSHSMPFFDLLMAQIEYRRALIPA